MEPTTDDLQNVNKFEFHAVTERDIEKIVKHIPSNKAPGQAKVSARVLKDSLAATRAVITNLIYSSFSSNCFAQAWNSAVVIPNLKSGDPDEPENTRPIALLPFWIKMARYLAYRVEIESSTPLKPPYCTTRTSSLRIWMKKVCPLLCCSTCLKIWTASNMTTYYQNCTYWLCRPPL